MITASYWVVRNAEGGNGIVNIPWWALLIIVIIAALAGAIMTALVSINRVKDEGVNAYREGYADGHRNGLRKGKVLKIDAELYEELKSRVDNAPGFDSVREGKA